MNNTPISEKTKEKLLNDTELILIEVTRAVDEVRNLLTTIEKVRAITGKKNINIPSENLENLLEYRMLIGLLILDLQTSIRIYLNAKYPYEKLYSARQIIVIINEGYKKIYNFITPKGGNKTKNREESFWVQDIGAIINNDTPSLKQEYDSLTNELEDFLANNFDQIKERRDLSIHYDRKPSKVYDMLQTLDIDGTYKKMMSFSTILNKMFEFTHKITVFYDKEKIAKDKKNLATLTEKMLSTLEKMKTNENETSICELQNSIRLFSKKFNITN